jgi:ribose transport system ATP-binding protein
VLNANGLTLAGRLREVSFEARAGEVLGVYGFMGCGQTELAAALFGKTRLERGSISVDGRRVRPGATARARRAGMAFVPESRRSMLFHQEPVYKNISISILDAFDAVTVAERVCGAAGRVLRIGPRPSPLGALGRQPAEGGLAKRLSFRRGAGAERADRGMDVGAKDEVVRTSRPARQYTRHHVDQPGDRVAADRVVPKGELVREFVGEVVRTVCWRRR